MQGGNYYIDLNIQTTPLDLVVEDEDHVQARRPGHRRIPIEDGKYRSYVRLYHGALLHGQEGHLVLAEPGICISKLLFSINVQKYSCIPTQVPERIFLVKKVPKPVRQQTSHETDGSDFADAAARDHPNDSASSEGRSPPAASGVNSAAGYDLIPEILSVTHDPRNPFKVEFDDPSWQSYMNYLLPLGLSIVLNTCNISTEEKYTNFFNHLVCESVRVDGHGHHSGKRSNIDVLPIVTRGCLCELARKIGFGPRTAAQYTLSSQIQVWYHLDS